MNDTYQSEALQCAACSSATDHPGAETITFAPLGVRLRLCGLCVMVGERGGPPAHRIFELAMQRSGWSDAELRRAAAGVVAR